MPLNLTGTDRKLLLAAGAVLAVLVVIALIFGRGVSASGLPSTYSSASDGCKAAYLACGNSATT